tara:strand:- start:32 stop:712 length:681 start_codon:yes stop_codon:yes gene_type:complete
MDYALIIPIFNEQNTLEKLLFQLKNFDKNLEVIIINDGSTDGTKSILEAQNDFFVLHNKSNKGKGFSIIKGVKSCSRKNIILMDGDLEIELASISRLIEEHKKYKNIVVVGSRWNQRKHDNFNINMYGNILINYLFNSLYNTSFEDVLCCVKILEKKLFTELNIKSHNFNIEMEIMSKLVLKDVKFLQKKVFYERRKSSDGKKIKLSDGWGILWEMVLNRVNNNKI